VLMDIQMPVMNGYEATRMIREFDTKTPIFALSAAVLERDKKSSEEAGMNEHIAKPIDPEALNMLMNLSSTLFKTIQFP